MRIAVFSDVHGNLAALEAVWADIKGQGVDTAVFAGDLCFMGPRPAACVQFVRDEGTPAIYGNTDEWMFGRQDAPEPRRAAAAWTREQLSEAERAWLGILPFAIRYQPGNDPGDALHIVHANPRDVNQIIFPPEDEQLARYGRVRQADALLEPLLVGVEAAVLVYGHLHIPSKRNRGRLLLANISSVSIPGDGDPRAKYGIFTWQNGRWEMELRRVVYDMAPEIAAYRQAQPPGWETIVTAIEEDGFLGQNV
jgi:predicted phosphodiesterase